MKEHGAKAAQCWGTGLIPQVPLNDKKMYPIYAKCVELDIPIFVYAGVPGPRIRFEPQYVGLLDEVCWFFPELKIITRHGGEPWTELMVKLLLKWPNLYYSTSAFAPKHYNEDIIDFANTRGADKIIYAGYFPMGLSLDRIFSELPERPVPRPRLAEVPVRERGARAEAGGLTCPARSPASASSSCRTSDRCSSRACCSPTWAPTCCASTARRDVASGHRTSPGSCRRTR